MRRASGRPGAGGHCAGAGGGGVGMVTVYDTPGPPGSVGVVGGLPVPVVAPRLPTVAAPMTATRTALRTTARVVGRVFDGWVISGSNDEGESDRFGGWAARTPWVFAPRIRWSISFFDRRSPVAQIDQCWHRFRACELSAGCVSALRRVLAGDRHDHATSSNLPVGTLCAPGT